jgi:hypothetical protein
MAKTEIYLGEKIAKAISLHDETKLLSEKLYILYKIGVRAFNDNRVVFGYVNLQWKHPCSNSWRIVAIATSAL